jgi:adenylylsulfate kinase-like enzyme
MCAKKIKMGIDKAQTEPDKKGLKHKTQKEEINDEIELLLKTLKRQQKRQKK